MSATDVIEWLAGSNVRIPHSTQSIEWSLQVGPVLWGRVVLDHLPPEVVDEKAWLRVVLGRLLPREEELCDALNHACSSHYTLHGHQRLMDVQIPPVAIQHLAAWLNAHPPGDEDEDEGDAPRTPHGEEESEEGEYNGPDSKAQTMGVSCQIVDDHVTRAGYSDEEDNNGGAERQAPGDFW